MDSGHEDDGHGHDEEEHGHDEGHGDESDDEHKGHDEHGDDSHSHGDGHGNEEKPAEKPKPAAGGGKKKGITESEVFTLLVLAVLGRVLLKVTPLVNIPSVEPIIPIAVFAGLSYGTEAGILVGLLAYPLSNLFLPEGVFGLWVFWQAVGGAIAGGLAGLAKKATFNNLVWFTVLGTVLFELAVNLPDQELLIFPFSFVHIISNFIFAALIGIFVLKEK